MKPPLEAYRDRRDKFLSEVVESLSTDERFVAGWLTGSISRNDDDALSDIDLRLVVAETYSTSLCARLEQVSAQTSPERFALFSQFGVPALIHENNNNVPEGGTLTIVLYAESAIMLDCVLMPQSKAKRPSESKLLFDRVGIPVAPPRESEDLEARKKSVAEMWAFFWMMSAITIKYINRNDGVFAAEWIEYLHALIREIERKMEGRPVYYPRGSLSQLQATREKQLESVRGLCMKMQDIRKKVTEFTGTEPLTPSAEIELLFSLVNQ
jgi:predicted nucleotidyltransferase